MIRLIPLDDRTFVAGQIGPADLPAIAGAGVTTIVNNRPDHEEPEQPKGREIWAAAQAAGLSYRNSPIAGTFSPSQIDAMAEALGQAEGKLLAYCRYGTRSTYLWALARARSGADPDTLIAQAAAAGYDLTPIVAHIRQFLPVPGRN